MIAIVILTYIIYIKTRKNNSEINQTYTKVVDVNNIKQLKDNFLWDNPNNNGTDPTGGMVDYSYAMNKDVNVKIINNINGDSSWNEIQDNATSKEL